MHGGLEPVEVSRLTAALSKNLKKESLVDSGMFISNIFDQTIEQFIVRWALLTKQII